MYKTKFKSLLSVLFLFLMRHALNLDLHLRDVHVSLLGKSKGGRLVESTELAIGLSDLSFRVLVDHTQCHLLNIEKVMKRLVECLNILCLTLERGLVRGLGAFTIEDVALSCGLFSNLSDMLCPTIREKNNLLCPSITTTSACPMGDDSMTSAKI